MLRLRLFSRRPLLVRLTPTIFWLIRPRSAGCCRSRSWSYPRAYRFIRRLVWLWRGLSGRSGSSSHRLARRGDDNRRVAARSPRHGLSLECIRLCADGPARSCAKRGMDGDLGTYILRRRHLCGAGHSRRRSAHDAAQVASVRRQCRPSRGTCGRVGRCGCRSTRRKASPASICGLCSPI